MSQTSDKEIIHLYPIVMKYIITILTLATFSLGAIAQTEANHQWKGKKGEAHNERMEQRKAEVKAELNLSEEQEAKFDRINEKYAMQRQQWRAEQKVQRQEFKAKMDESRASQKDEINQILTPEQRTKLEEIREAKKAEHKARKSEMKRKHGK